MIHTHVSWCTHLKHWRLWGLAMRGFGDFLRHDGGNFGILTALMMVPLVGVAGLAIDFGRALDLRAQLAAAADAAAVGAIAEKSAAVAQAMAAPGNTSFSLDTTEARRLFFGQTSANGIDIPVDLDIQLVKSDNVITSRVSYSSTLPTTFMQVLGKKDITISNTATAIYQTPAFMDFYMLLDNTPSMGVAATMDAIDDMIYATRYGNQKPGSDKGKDANCAFACHIVFENGDEDPYSYYKLAQSKRIPIRIDVVAEAVKSLMVTAKSTQTMTSQFRMAAYTFGERAQDAKLFKVAELNENLGTVGGATDKIKLMSIPYQNYNNDQQTSFDDALKGIKDEIMTKTGTFGAPGYGTSRNDRQKIVFMVADGVGDSYKPNKCTRPANNGRCIEPIDTRSCKALKDSNIRIAVLYTTYLPLKDNDFWNSRVKPFDSSIDDKMRECASPGYFFEVTLEQGIEEAMETLFRKIVAMPRITS